jgi:hypothetical protein
MPAWLPLMIAGGSILSKAGAGAAKERGNQNAFQLRQNELNQQAHRGDMEALLDALKQNEAAKMNRAQLGIQAPSARAKQALLGSLMANARTARVTPPAGIRMGTVSGGLDLDALLTHARGAGRTLNAQATQALETGSDVPAYEDATSRLSKSPTPGGYKKAGKMESLMSLLGLVGAGAGAYKSARGASAPSDPTIPEMDAVSKAALGF